MTVGRTLGLGQEAEAEHAYNIAKFISESTLHKTGSLVLPKELKQMRSEVCERLLFVWNIFSDLVVGPGVGGGGPHNFHRHLSLASLGQS